MRLRKELILRILIPLVIFLFALFLRQYFFQGFILGDDPLEVSASIYNLENGPDLHDAFHLRFGVWIFNVASFKLFGISEFSFFLPTLLMSASLSVIGYFILIFWKYPRKYAFLAGLFIASAPFEIMLGTVRANDLILSWVLSIGLLCFIIFDKRPTIQGILMAFFFWLAFYVKILAVYFLPPLIIYYLIKGIRQKSWRGGTSFVITSVIFHGTSSIIFKILMGEFLPFIHRHPPMTPVATKDLANLFLIYPKMIFIGSEFGTTLFGYVPYLLLLLLIIKAILPKPKSTHSSRFDKWDICLIALYGTFFILSNFFPTTFKFDQYYSPPRIFRYLAPLSFPMTLHLAKLIPDLSKIAFKNRRVIQKHCPTFLFLILIICNVYQTNEATKPGQTYRESLLSIIDDVKQHSPPVLLTDSWLTFFLRNFYLKEFNHNIITAQAQKCDTAKDYENWLKEVEPNLPNGTMLITGLGFNVHYGCHTCGFRLSQFKDPLNPGWHLYKEYGMLDYLPTPEPARLWQWTSAQENNNQTIPQPSSCDY